MKAVGFLCILHAHTQDFEGCFRNHPVTQQRLRTLDADGTGVSLRVQGGQAVSPVCVGHTRLCLSPSVWVTLVSVCPHLCGHTHLCPRLCGHTRLCLSPSVWSHPSLFVPVCVVTLISVCPRLCGSHSSLFVPICVVTLVSVYLVSSTVS